MVDAGQFWCTGRCSDVSTEELTLTDVRSSLPPGTGVDVYFELAGLVAIEARAVVIRIEGPRITLRFLDLDSASVDALESYVSGGFHSSTHIRQRPLASAE